LTGVWKQDKVGRHLQLNEDWAYRYASEAVWLEKAPREIRQFRLEGTLLTLIPSDESYDCKGQPGSYQVELTEEDHLQLEITLYSDPPVEVLEYNNRWFSSLIRKNC
jgi:hypothetical protein